MKYFYLVIWMIVSYGVHGQFISNQGIEIHNTALLVTNGDWTNDATSSITNHGVISTTESFVNNGKLDGSSRGGFHLRFATDLAFQPGTGTSAMGVFNKEGAGAALVTGTIFVRDSLLLKDGLLRLQNVSDTISLGENAILSSGENAYVEGGLVARAGKGDLIFPMGRDGHYLPLRIFKMQAQKVAVTVGPAPPAYTAGPGVDALINFPYVWTVIKANAADTAAYIEINYPASLPVVSNPIVVREIPGQQYASMGARFIEDTGSRITVRSYSRRLNGSFTVAQGFPSDPVTDSLALVSLYNSTGGQQWVNATNWLTAPVENWFGITVTGQSITSVELPSNNLTGPVADPLVDILSLETINLSGNQITTLPDFTLNPEVTSLNVSDNNLDFSSLEPNAAITGINYFIQADIGAPLDTLVVVGSTYPFTVSAGGASSEYKWRFNGEEVSGATAPTYILPAINRENMGEYVAEITNPNLPGLILKSAPQKVLAYADVSGKLFADAEMPAEGGELTLFRVQPGAFLPFDTVSVANDGSFTFEKVILDDYQLRGFADTLLYPLALPTYYENTIFWEEADTLVLTDHISALDIVSQLEPGPPSGRGVISGYLQEDDGTGRVMGTERNKKIGRVGVSARRVERTGRTKGEILTLVAYVFTNDEGEFNLTNLSPGEYRLNFQYPGYPMDETSYTTIIIGTGLESHVIVEANVIDGQINVRKLVITGLLEAENYHAEVYPNPAVGFINLKFAGEVKERNIQLHDMQGRVIHSMKAVDKDVVVDVTKLQRGMYLLQIQENQRKVKTLKISIED